MKGKGSAVFWIGLMLIFLNFWTSHQSTRLWKGLTTGPAASGKQGAVTNPVKGKCPPGHILFNGKCAPSAVM